MDRTQIDELVTKFRSGEVSRRGFIRKATALGISAGAASMLAGSAGAQNATPGASPAPGTPITGVPASPAAEIGAVEGEVVSIAPPSREEFLSSLREAFAFEDPEVEGGQVIYGQTTDIATMNWNVASDSYSHQVAGWVYETLVSSSPIDGGFVPGLADTWDVEEDGLTYTFQLNPNATWHDGMPVTAEDVVFSFDSVLAEESLSPYRGSILEMLDSYEAVDEQTVRFVARERFATFIENTVVLVAVMPRHIWENVPPADWGTDPGSTGADPSRVVGSGPFRFVEWVQEDHVTLEKWSEYWNPEFTPVIDTFTYRVIPEESANIQALLTGEIDYAELPFTEAPALTEEPDLQVQAWDSTNLNWYAANQDPARSEFFIDVRVRKALMYALDRQLLAEQVYNGYAIPANGTQPVLSVAYEPERINTEYNFDPDMARQLLEEAGWVDEDGDGVREQEGVRFSFECLFSEGVATYEQQIPYMQQAWAEVGIEMIPTAVPFTSLLDATDTGEFQMAVFGFSWSIDGGQLPMFGCEYLPPNGFNSMRYCNPRYDELSMAAERELDPDARIDLLIEASNMVWDEQAAGYIVFRQEIAGARNTLHNFFPNGYLFDWWLPFAWTEVQ